jgi:hypothetical protein
MPTVVEKGGNGERKPNRERNDERNHNKIEEGMDENDKEQMEEGNEGVEMIVTAMRKGKDDKNEEETEKGKEIREKKKRKERYASRNMTSENDQEQEDVLDDTSEKMCRPTRRRSQRVQEAIRMKNNEGSLVTEYEEIDTSIFIKYVGNYK